MTVRRRDGCTTRNPLGRFIGHCGDMTEPAFLLSAHEARTRARKALSPETWRYLETRADVSFRDRNSAAWRILDLRPRVLRGVSHPIDTAIRCLGKMLPTPILTAPNGRATRYHPDGELAVMAGAAAGGGGRYPGQHGASRHSGGVRATPCPVDPDLPVWRSRA